MIEPFNFQISENIAKSSRKMLEDLHLSMEDPSSIPKIDTFQMIRSLKKNYIAERQNQNNRQLFLVTFITALLHLQLH